MLKSNPMMFYLVTNIETICEIKKAATYGSAAIYQE